MTNEQSTEQDTTERVFACGEALDVICIADLHQSLRSALEKRQPFALDASRVERVDTTALQLLCAFVRTATGDGLTFRWHQTSAPVREAVKTLGMEAVLFPDPGPAGGEEAAGATDG